MILIELIMDFLDTIKILVAPYLALFSLCMYLLTDNNIYLFISGGILIIFSIVFLIMLIFILVKFGVGAVIETEIEPLPWLIFFLTLLLYLYLNLSLIL